MLASSVRLDTTPPRPRVTSIGPRHEFGPELLPTRRAATPSCTSTRPGTSPSSGCSRPGRGPTRLVLEDEARCRTARRSGAGTAHAERPPGLAGDLPRRDRDPRRGRQPRPLAAAEPPRPARDELRRQAARARRHHRSLPRRAPAQRRHAARATRSSSSSTRGASRGRWSVRRVGSSAATPEPPQDLGARAPARSRARVGRLPAAGAHRHALRRRCPSRSRAPSATRVLVVLPVMTWQGRNSLDDDGDGLPNLLDRGVGAKLFRVYAGDGLPADFATRDAPLLAWLDRRGHRYDITTDVALAAGRGPRLEDHKGVILPSDVRWLPRALQQRLRRYVRDGGQRRHLRHRLAAPPGLAHAPRADDRSHPARDDRRLRRAPAPAAAPAQAQQPRRRRATTIDFFGGTAGAFGPFSLVQEVDLADRPPPARSPRTRRPGGRSSRRRAWARASCCASASPSSPSHLSARANDPNTTALLDRTWTLLSH